MRSSLKLRLSLLVGILGLMQAAAVLGFSYVTMQKELDGQQRSILLDKAEQARHVLDEMPDAASVKGNAFRLVDLVSNRPELHLSIAHALKTVGRTSEAIESYRAAAAARPNFGDAYWSLANLKTFRFTDAELQQMQAQLARADLKSEDRWHFHFALGKSLEDRQQYAPSFTHYREGNTLRRAQIHYDPAEGREHSGEVRPFYEIAVVNQTPCRAIHAPGQVRPAEKTGVCKHDVRDSWHLETSYA